MDNFPGRQRDISGQKYLKIFKKEETNIWRNSPGAQCYTFARTQGRSSLCPSLVGRQNFKLYCWEKRKERDFRKEARSPYTTRKKRLKLMSKVQSCRGSGVKGQNQTSVCREVG